MIEGQLATLFSEIDTIVGDVRNCFNMIRIPDILPSDWINHLDAIKSPQYDISIVGMVKAGKSTLLNALFFGAEVLPTEVIECTAAIATIRRGDKDTAHVSYMTQKEMHHAIADIRASLASREERTAYTKSELEQEASIMEEALRRYESETNQKEFSLDALKQCIAKDDSSGNNVCPIYRTRLVKEVMIETLNSLVKDNIRFVDTPGIHSPVKSRVDLTISKIQDSDCVLLLIPPRGIDQATIDFLRDVIPNCPAGKIFALIGKCDYLASEMLVFDKYKLVKIIKNQVDDLQNRLSSMLTDVHSDFRNIQVIPVAPKLALDYLNSDLSLCSNLGRLQTLILSFLESGKGMLEFESACHRLSAVLKECRARTQKRKIDLQKEVFMLNSSVREIEEQLKTIKAVELEIVPKVEGIKISYKAKAESWESGFRNRKRSIVENAKRSVNDYFNEARSSIKQISGIVKIGQKYQEKAREIINKMKCKIELEVFWNIQQQLQSFFDHWYHSCRKEAKEALLTFVQDINNEYQDILGHIGETIQASFDTIYEVQFTQLNEIKDLVNQGDIGLLSYILFFKSPDFEPRLQKYNDEIIKSIENEINTNSDQFMRECISLFKSQKEKVVGDLHKELQRIREKTEEVLKNLNNAKFDRDRRMQAIQQETDEYDHIHANIDNLLTRLKLFQNSIPPMSMKGYTDLDTDIEAIADACCRIQEITSSSVDY